MESRGFRSRSAIPVCLDREGDGEQGEPSGAQNDQERLHARTCLKGIWPSNSCEEHQEEDEEARQQVRGASSVGDCGVRAILVRYLLK